jgi:subtilisin family serine protease
VRRSLVAAALVLVATASALVTGSTTAAERTSTFIVDLTESVSARRDAARIAEAYGGRATYIYDRAVGGFAFEGTDRDASRLAHDRRVVSVERDAVYHAVNVPPDLNHLNKMDVPEAYASGYDGDGVTIAVLDTGVYKKHTVFQAHANILPGKSCVDGGTNDLEGHGTATHSNAVGKIGVAHLAKAVPVKVFPGASLSTTAARIICGLDWVTDENTDVPGTIDVVNMSIAGIGSPAMSNAIDDVQATDAIVVAASGNAGGPAPLCPACYSGVISVSAMGGNDNLASFSNDGADVAAPGVNIKSAENGGGYSRRSGTSRAAPAAAGVIAIMLGEGADPADIPQLLRESGRCPNGDVNSDGGDCDGDGQWGNDSDDPEPLVNAYCAGALVDALNVEPACGEI